MSMSRILISFVECFFIQIKKKIYIYKRIKSHVLDHHINIISTKNLGYLSRINNLKCLFRHMMDLLIFITQIYS